MTLFDVIALGVGDTFSERYHPTSLLLVADGFKLAIDCPDMYRRVLRDASLKGAGPLAITDIDDVLLYTTPQRQFPTTVVLSAERRNRLLELAAQHRIPLIEDDHDSDFTFGDQPVLPLASQDTVGQVIYTTSLGRMIAPGIRLGCIVGSADLVDKLARVQRNLELQGDHVVEWAAADLIRDGDMGRQLRKARKIYEERMHFLVKHLQQKFGEKIEVHVPGGGLALWIRFRIPEMASPWIDAMRIRGLVLNHPRNYFLTEPGPFTRMGFAQVSEVVLSTSIEKMRLALEDIAWSDAWETSSGPFSEGNS